MVLLIGKSGHRMKFSGIKTLFPIDLVHLASVRNHKEQTRQASLMSLFKVLLMP